MVVWAMKTTIEISDSLMAEAKEFARGRGITLRTVIERGVRLALKNGGENPEYKFEDKSVNGSGLVDPNMTWDEMLEISYGDRY